MVARIALKVLAIPKVNEFDVVRGDYHLTLEIKFDFHSPHMCSVIAIKILDAVLFSSGNQNLPQSDQALNGNCHQTNSLSYLVVFCSILAPDHDGVIRFSLR